MNRLVSALCLGVIIGFPPLVQAQDQAGAYLENIDQLLSQAHTASQNAERATSVQELKMYTDAVFETIWGAPSGLLSNTGAALAHGWKTRWQTDGTEFDEAHVERHGSDEPMISDPETLGIMGQGRAVVKMLVPRQEEPHADHVLASLSNVIGWMRLSDGVTKGERQPRIDLTHVWDAPTRFWNTTADTGWLGEVHAQTINILKTEYGENLAIAQEHAKAMTALLEICRSGKDENGDGAVAPIMMEGGLDTAIQHAGYLGIVN